MLSAVHSDCNLDCLLNVRSAPRRNYFLCELGRLPCILGIENQFSFQQKNLSDVVLRQLELHGSPRGSKWILALVVTLLEMLGCRLRGLTSELTGPLRRVGIWARLL